MLIARFILRTVLFIFTLLGLLGKEEKEGSIPGLFIYLGLPCVGMIVLLWLALRDVPG